MKRLIPTLAFLFVTLLSLFSQVPQGFNFQALARDGNGELLANASMNVVVKIRVASETGLVIWEEQHDVVSNEFGLFSLVVCGDNSLRSSGTAETVEDIPWGTGQYFLDLSIDAGGGMVELGATALRSVPYSMVSASTIQNMNTLEIQPTTATEPGEALFIVRREDGYPIFAVYEDGVRVFTDEAVDGKGLKGGFAVGGYNKNKGVIGQTYMSVTPDSTRIYVNEQVVKGLKGGFAVGGYNKGKAEAQDFFLVTQDSTRVYVNDLPDKGVKGGFAVGGYNKNKGNEQTFMSVTPDSTRVYVNTDVAKGVKGGFAVGGYNKNKGEEGAFMSLTKENYFIGQNSGSNVTGGVYNSVLGYESGKSITSGESNVFLGYQSGYLNDVGSGNLFLGYQSGYINTFGNFNTFMGYQAGHSNWGGTNNTFLGSFSGFKNAGGSYNTFIGDSAGYYTSYGNYNTFLGTKAGVSTTTGYSNVFLGNDAGNKNKVGSENVLIGRQSGYSSDSAWRNVFIGVESGYSNTTGWDNIIVGTQAGKSLIDGAGNVFLGYQAGLLNEHGTRNVFIGNHAGYNEKGTGKLYISNTDLDSTGSLIWGDFYAGQLRFNANVGFGIDAVADPLSVYNPNGAGSISLYGKGNGYDYSGLTLHRDTSSLDHFFSISHNQGDDLYIGYFAADVYHPRLIINEKGNLGINTDPYDNTLAVVDDDDVGKLFLQGAGNTYDYAAISLVSSGQPLDHSYNIAHDKTNAFALVYHDGTDFFSRFRIDETGKMGINNWDNPTEVLDVNGNARFRGVGTAAGGMDLLITPEGVLTTSASDARLKEDFQPLENSLEKVLNLDGVTFNWKDNESGQRDAGLIAQDVAGIFPEAVFVNANDGFYGVNYSRFPALFVEAFKEQQQIIDEQKGEIDEQKGEIDELKARLERLEQLLVLE